MSEMAQDREQYKIITNEKAFFKNAKDAVNYLVRHVPDTGKPKVYLVKIDVSWKNNASNYSVTNNVIHFLTVKDAVDYIKNSVPDASKVTLQYLNVDVTWESMEWPYL